MASVLPESIEFIVEIVGLNCKYQEILRVLMKTFTIKIVSLMLKELAYAQH